VVAVYPAAVSSAYPLYFYSQDLLSAQEITGKVSSSLAMRSIVHVPAAQVKAHFYGRFETRVVAMQS
jgi:hypothetical protein